MQRISVVSSNLASVGHEAGIKLLEIEFHDGRVYQYEDVPESSYHALMSADSIGSYFHRHIRDKYRTTRIQ
ncbi:MAG: KTSC domain-containing protein [bacterium]|nr:KTSC domain-containing protein [bacterium]